MKTTRYAQGDKPHIELGAEAVSQLARLRSQFENREGFNIYLCGFDSPAVLQEVERRIHAFPPEGVEIESVSLKDAGGRLAIVEALIGVTPAEENVKKVVFASFTGSNEDLRGIWAEALQRLNERRNIVIRDCPNAIILAGPGWLPQVAHDMAPDLWSVRTASFSFLSPAQTEYPNGLEHSEWPSGLPMAHLLEDPGAYERLAEALEHIDRTGEQGSRGRLLLKASLAWGLRGDYRSAFSAAEKAGDAFNGAKDRTMFAVSRGYIADILQQQGQTDEALRIRREEELPVYEQFGDVREQAVAMGKIADILRQQGQTGEALRIRREEELPVYEQIGDVRSRAVTMGKIADILQQQGQTDEALRIRREEELPVFEQLGDVRERAVTIGKIADILQQQGQTDEALRIIREEQLPVFEQIGDVYSRAVTMGQIADILQQQGQPVRL